MNSIIDSRFSTPIMATSDLLKKSNKTKNPGLYFFENGGRNILFRLEALCRIYRKHDSGKFLQPWYDAFKSLEDAMGAIDHNQAMAREFASFKEIRKVSDREFGRRFEAQVAFLSQSLSEQGWLNGKMLDGFSNDLKKNWKLNDKNDREWVSIFLVDEMDQLEKGYRKGKLNPESLENGIHELRRKVRWVSIYASALNGMIQLKMVPVLDQELKKYCTKDIIQSPFNKLPQALKELRPITLQSTPFFALSWLIKRLSDIKDSGLRMEAMNLIVDQGSFASSKAKELFLNKYVNSLPFAVDELATNAEMEMDGFLYKNRIFELLKRDILRSTYND